MSTTQVVVGRIGKPHGIRGELSVEPRTDEPERRFAVGAVLVIDDEPLSIRLLAMPNASNTAIRSLQNIRHLLSRWLGLRGRPPTPPPLETSVVAAGVAQPAGLGGAGVWDRHANWHARHEQHRQ